MEKHILKRLDALEDFAKEIRAALAAPATAPEQMPLERDCICHQYLHLDAYSGGAAPEGLHGALWVVVEGVRKKYVLADGAGRCAQAIRALKEKP